MPTPTVPKLQYIPVDLYSRIERHAQGNFASLAGVPKSLTKHFAELIRKNPSAASDYIATFRRRVKSLAAQNSAAPSAGVRVESITGTINRLLKHALDSIEKPTDDCTTLDDALAELNAAAKGK